MGMEKLTLFITTSRFIKRKLPPKPGYFVKHVPWIKYLLFTVHVYDRLMRIHWTFYIYFDQILTTFNKLKIMSEAVHNHWKKLKYLQIS